MHNGANKIIEFEVLYTINLSGLFMNKQINRIRRFRNFIFVKCNFIKLWPHHVQSKEKVTITIMFQFEQHQDIIWALQTGTQLIKVFSGVVFEFLMTYNFMIYVLTFKSHFPFVWKLTKKFTIWCRQ